MQDFSNLESRLGYCFKDNNLLLQALTHRSASGEHYERLEFLGDAILDMVVSAELFRRFPEASEGQLTKMRSNLVRRESLASMATNIKLGEFIIFGPGEMKSGSHRRESILADVFESIIGAVYVDADFDIARNFLLDHLKNKLDECNPDEITKDAKTRLQEYLQARGLPIPEYNVIEVTGPAHKQSFRISCYLSNPEMSVEGQGSSRKRAEQDAAQKMYQRVTND